MTIRSLIALAVFSGSYLTADAQTSLLLIRAGAPPGVTVIDAGTTNVTQHVIPRYANGSSYPAGQLLGWGAASVVSGNASTPSLPAATRAIVVTEAFSSTISKWQNGTVSEPAVLQPKLSDVTIIGYDAANPTYTSAGLVG